MGKRKLAQVRPPLVRNEASPAYLDGYQRGIKHEHLYNSELRYRSYQGIAELATHLGYDEGHERAEWIKGYLAGHKERELSLAEKEIASTPPGPEKLEIPSRPTKPLSFVYKSETHRQLLCCLERLVTAMEDESDLPEIIFSIDLGIRVYEWRFDVMCKGYTRRYEADEKSLSSMLAGIVFCFSFDVLKELTRRGRKLRALPPQSLVDEAIGILTTYSENGGQIGEPEPAPMNFGESPSKRRKTEKAKSSAELQQETDEQQRQWDAYVAVWQVAKAYSPDVPIGVSFAGFESRSIGKVGKG